VGHGRWLRLHRRSSRGSAAGRLAHSQRILGLEGAIPNPGCCRAENAVDVASRNSTGGECRAHLGGVVTIHRTEGCNAIETIGAHHRRVRGEAELGEEVGHLGTRRC
jgi:hypothetical protein